MEMKEYKAPEMEVVEMKYSQALLAGSINDPSAPGTGDMDEY